MDQEVVTALVRQLKNDGEQVTVRRLHETLGGSFRDLSRYLREAREFLDEEEVAALDADLPEPSPPAPGQIREAFASAAEALREAGEVSSLLYSAQERLKDLVEQRPRRPANPSDLEDWVLAKGEYIKDVAVIHETIAELQREVSSIQDQRRAFQAQGNRLQQRERELTLAILPRCQREVAEAEQALAHLLRDQEHARKLAEQRVARTYAALRAYETELQGLTGG